MALYIKASMAGASRVADLAERGVAQAVNSGIPARPGSHPSSIVNDSTLAFVIINRAGSQQPSS